MASTQSAGTQALGEYGERIAARHLTEAGMRILAQRWRCRWVEVDIIAEDGEGGDAAQTLVICEVKTRRGLGYGDPLESITYAKVRRLRELAMEWVRSQEERVGPVRLDAVGVLVDARGLSSVRHVVNLEKP